MEKAATIFGGALLVAAGVFFLVTLGTLIGACCGWVVGLFFGDTILGTFAQLGLHNVTMWQVGAFLGFVGGFFRTSVTSKS